MGKPGADRRLLIITYYWPPSGGAGVQRWLKFATYLDQFGWEIHVLTVDPGKATYPHIDESMVDEVPKSIFIHKTGTREPYKLYQRLTRSSTPAGGFANSKQKPNLLQTLSLFARGNLFIPDSRRGWNPIAYRRALGLLKEFNISTVITTSPPHSTQLIGQRLKSSTNCRWIADFRDPWTDIYYYNQFKHTAWSRRRDKKLELGVLRNADIIITVSNSLKELLQGKLDNLALDKFKIITNGYDPADFLDLEVTTAQNFTVGYMGTITSQYHLGPFLQLLSHYKERIELCFVGELPADIIRQLHVLQIKYINHGYKNHKKALELINGCNALLLAIPKVPRNEGIITGKLFEYLALMKPIIGIGPINGDAASILEKTGSGIMHDYEDAELLTHTLNKLIDEAPKNSTYSRSTIDDFSRKSLTKQLEQIITDVTCL